MVTWTPEEIKDLRTRLVLSRRATGELLGVSGTYIYLLEKGVKTPSKTLNLLLGYVEKEVTENETRKGGKKYDKRHI